MRARNHTNHPRQVPSPLYGYRAPRALHLYGHHRARLLFSRSPRLIPLLCCPHPPLLFFPAFSLSWSTGVVGNGPPQHTSQHRTLKRARRFLVLIGFWGMVRHTCTSFGPTHLPPYLLFFKSLYLARFFFFASSVLLDGSARPAMYV